MKIIEMEVVQGTRDLDKSRCFFGLHDQDRRFNARTFRISAIDFRDGDDGFVR